MVFRRSFRKGRRFKKRFGKKPRGRRIAKRYSSMVYSYKRTTNGFDVPNFNVDGTIVSKTGGFVNITLLGGGAAGGIDYGSIGFQALLEDCNAYTEFTNLYDQYKIIGAGIKITPFSTQALSSDATSGIRYGYINAFVHSANDYDDAALPTASEAGIDVLRQYATYKCKRMIGGKPLKYFIRPKMLQRVYGGATDAYNTTAPKWLDTATADASHFGWKAVVAVGPSTGNASDMFIKCRVEITYYMKFKNVR